MKEPISGALAIFAVTNLVFGVNSRKDRLFYALLLINSAIHIAVYVYIAFWKSTGGDLFHYIAFRTHKESSAFLQTPFLIVMMCVFLLRLYFLMVKKDKGNLLSDSLLLAGVGYAVVYLIFIRINRHYLLFPAIVLSVPAIARWLCASNERASVIRKSLSFVICLTLSFYNSSKEIAGLLSARKNDPPQLISIAQKHLNGKRLVMICDDLLKSCREMRRNTQRSLLNDLLAYYAGKSGQSVLQLQHLKAKEQLKISKDDVLIIPHFNMLSRRYRKILDELERNDFHFFDSLATNHVFLKDDDLKQISLPCRYNFRKPTMAQNMRNYGFIYRHKGLFSFVSGSRVKFKVPVDDLLVVLDVTTKHLENHPLSIFMNGKMILQKDLKSRWSGKIKLEIPRELIPSGVLVISFGIGKTDYEKDLKKARNCNNHDDFMDFCEQKSWIVLKSILVESRTSNTAAGRR
jgi:hypothetical protein